MNEHFMEYNDILNRINEVQQKIIILKENIYNIKGISYDDIPKSSSSNNDITYFLIDIEELENELENLMIKKTKLKNKHEKEIAKLSSNKYKSVLRMYYLLKFDMFEISETLQISVSYAHKLKKLAVKEFMSITDTKV